MGATSSDSCLYPAVTGASMGCDINQYMIGNTVELSAQFYDADQNPIDPSTVALKIKDPTGNESSFTPSHDGMGAYSYTFVPTMSGNYFYRFEGSGSFASAVENQFLVLGSNVTD